MSETLALSHGLPSTIREGEVLGGKYRLEREIGRGAMGMVWSAVHLTLGQRVAIKLIAAEHAQSAEARARFSIEAKAAARLRSRYVVQVYDDGETPAGTPYIVLEYLEGESLEQRLERERDLPLNDAVRVTRHVARALSRAHAQGIVHRDLKPGNVFLARSEDDDFGWLAKVLDFGIAKLEEHGVTSTTKTGTLLGTPLFMSPEQVRASSSLDARSDLYSLGMVFYTMLTGNYAFNGESSADVLVAICTAPLPDLRTNAPWLPQSVADWFQRAGARQPQDRFQSADEMVEALDMALGVSTGAFNQGQSTEQRLDTLRGHAPPIAHGVPRAPLADSGQFAKGSTQVLATDSVLLKSAHDRPGQTLAPTIRRSKPLLLALLIVTGFLLLLLSSAALLAFHRHTAGVRLAVDPPPNDPLPGATASTSVASAPTADRPSSEKVSAEASVVDASAPSRTAPAPVNTSPNLAKTPGKRGSVPTKRPRPPSRNSTTDMGF